MVLPAEATKVLGTLAAVYGWFIPAIGWGYALGVWAYALVWFLINSYVKIQFYRLMQDFGGHQLRHLRRVEGRLHNP